MRQNTTVLLDTNYYERGPHMPRYQAAALAALELESANSDSPRRLAPIHAWALAPATSSVTVPIRA